ncbi:MAG: glutamine synthetase family protein [Spirochaetes bacterium]|nr:glutamine synthetase family protein [Spirochaetota bacterium]
MSDDKEFVLKLAHANGVKFIRLWFTDILGFLKSFAITIDELEDSLTEGVRFDCSTVLGKISHDEFEGIALPDPTTFKILPWRPKEDAVARMFCDLYTTDMTPFVADSRHVLKRNLQKLAHKGYTFYTGAEIEFFFFKNNNTPEIIDRGGYYDLIPLDLATDYRRQIVLTLENIGIGVISSHHEGAFSQHEIDLRHEDALTTADNIMTFKLIAKEIAHRNGIYASFMPKPIAGQNGSGMHIHLSIFKEDTNIFYSAENQFNLSREAQHFIAGLLHHCSEFFLLTNQWINSYKRLVPGYDAPTHISWGHGDYTTLIRVPKCRKEKPRSTRIELKNPDSAINPYLVFAAVLASGMKGIEEQYELPAPINLEQKPISKKDILRMGLQPIPSSLEESLQNFEKSSLMRETLGDYIVNMIVENKLAEIHKYNYYITDYEINEYFPYL